MNFESQNSDSTNANFDQLRHITTDVSICLQNSDEMTGRRITENGSTFKDLLTEVGEAYLSQCQTTNNIRQIHI